MTKMKQTQCGGSSSRQAGMATARFGAETERSQFEDIDKEDWLDLDDPQCKSAQQAAQEGEANKSTGETGEGIKAVGKPTPTVDPQQTTAQGPTTDPPQPLSQAPTDNPPQPQASTSKADTQDPTENPEEENDPGLVEYVRSYQQAAKVWLDTVQASKEKVYNTLYDTLLQIGNPHIAKFSNSDKKTVLDCIADKSGKYLTKDDFAVYVGREDVEITKKQYAISAKAKAAIKEY